MTSVPRPERRTLRAAAPDEASGSGPPGELETVVASPWCAEPPLSTLDAWITPTPRFFVRSHFPTPKATASDWRVSLEGEVERPRSLTLAELNGFPDKELVVTLECAGNSRSAIYPRTKGVRWQHGAVGTARWRGVALADVLRSAGVGPGARDVVLEGADRGLEEGGLDEIPYAMSLPIEKALDPDTVLAFEMNGAPLSPDHGFPIRAIVPGWYGMASVKWLRRIRVLERPFDGYFRSASYVVIREGDDPDGPKTPVTSLLVKSLITWPPEDGVLPPGRHLVRGVAWSGAGAIRQVQVAWAPVGSSEESAPWGEATLLGPTGRHAWIRWECPIELERPGYYILRARATDEAGATQPAHPTWNFRGVATNAVHAVAIAVRRRR